MEVVDGKSVYPKGTKDRRYYLSSEDEQMGIETFSEQDNLFKLVELSSGKTGLVRELTGKEAKTAAQIAKGRDDLGMAAYIALSTEVRGVDGKVISFVAEDLDSWKAKDVNRLTAACSALNF